MSARSESLSGLSSMLNGLYFNPSQPQIHSPKYPIVQCRYFNSKYGCRRGNNCFYAHHSGSSNPQYHKTPSTTKLLETMMNNQNTLLEQNKSLMNELYSLKIKLKEIEENQQTFNNKQKAIEASKNCISGRDTADVSKQINITSSIQKGDESKYNVTLNDDANKLCDITDSYIAGLTPATIQTTNAGPVPATISKASAGSTSKAGISPAQKTESLSDKNKDINFEKMNDLSYPLNDRKAELIHKKYFPKNKNKQAYFIYLNHMNNNEDITLDEYNYLFQGYREKLKQKRNRNNNNKSNTNKTKFNNKRNKKNRK